MRAAASFAAGILALSRYSYALTREQYGAGQLFEDGTRELMSFVSTSLFSPQLNFPLAEGSIRSPCVKQTVVFEECKDESVDECLQQIQSDVEQNPEIFEGRQTLTPVVHKVRERSDPGYYKVVLVTNLAETGVVGIHGDGIVTYPFEWCTPHPSGGDPECREIGPWDCDVGTPLTVEQCCTMIQASVPNADVEGNHLECHASYPVGSISNPVDYGRVSIATDSEGNVIRPPRNE
jgi:hypothetical protein